MLAGSRFLLAFIVVNAHVGMAFPADQAPPAYMFGRQFGPLAAVIGFLIISGFSIGESFKRPEGFYRRRAGRVWPTLFVAVALFAAILMAWGPITLPYGSVANKPTALAVVCTLLGLNGFFVGSFLGPTWSLSVELLFYWLTPLFHRMGTSVLVALIGISAIFYWLQADMGAPTLPAARYGIAAGLLLWAWLSGFLYSRSAAPWTALLMGGLCIVLIGHFNDQGGSYSGLTLFAVAIAIVAGRHVYLPGRVRSVLDYLGDISYPLYLIHYPIIVLLAGVVGVRTQLPLVAASLAASVICLHLFERPMRRILPTGVFHIRIPWAVG